MKGNSWAKGKPGKDLKPLHPLPNDLSTEHLTAIKNKSTRIKGTNRFKGRRQKAVVLFTMIWSGTIALNLFTWGSWFILGLTTIMGVHAVRILFARPSILPPPLTGESPSDYPLVSLLVAAKNEAGVIANVVKMLCNVDYPMGRYEVWVIDDGSTDQTPQILKQLTEDYPQLKILYRSDGSMGGKSGALNAVLPATIGEFIVVFDADAIVSPDLLRRVLPVFNQLEVGAVQVRKAIAQTDLPTNPDGTRNFWLWGQRAEMAMDSFFQQQRIAIGGIGELRGNGQFVRRHALNDCGGWNEETITDDLDMTLRLHLADWDVKFVLYPAVFEEGVKTAKALWHQRNRWAEGGYQRYLDYWDLLIQNRLGLAKSLDLVMFFFTQYIMPTAMVPDLLMVILRNRPPLLAPIGSLTISLSLIGMFLGLHRTHNLPVDGNPYTVVSNATHGNGRSPQRILRQTIHGTLYMLHWILIITCVTARMSIRPKQLKWIKTTHQGTGH